MSAQFQRFVRPFTCSCRVILTLILTYDHLNTLVTHTTKNLCLGAIFIVKNPYGKHWQRTNRRKVKIHIGVCQDKRTTTSQTFLGFNVYLFRKPQQIAIAKCIGGLVRHPWTDVIFSASPAAAAAAVDAIVISWN